MSLLKNGWHPSGDKEIHRSSWKKDLKGIAGRKDTSETDRARNHVSAPLSTLKDPDSFGPPPKHTGYYPKDPQTATKALPSSSKPVVPKRDTSSYADAGLGAATPLRASARVNEEEPAERLPPQSYSVNTTGLRTDNLPLPPGRRDVPATPTGGRPVPAPPPRTSTAPAPSLPPRQSENPSEYDPPPPPTYGEATQSPISQAGAINRLAQAGVSVPGLDITPKTTQPQGHTGQLSELQQRFARMNGGGESSGSPGRASPVASSASPSIPSWKQAQAAHSALGGNATLQSAASMSNNSSLQSAVSMASQKKKPPPPPAKKAELSGDAAAPPPIPMSSKPRPG